jgi:hypothetical protein
MADPADDDLLKNAVQVDAEPGTQDSDQTPGDPADARPEGEASPAEPTGDDSTHDSDPLLLAQQSAPVAEPEPAKPAEPPKNEKTTTQPKAEPPKQGDTPATEPEPDPTANLPPEVWDSIPHKAKSVFLSQRKAIQAARARDQDVQKAREGYETVDKLRMEQGLEPEEFVNGTVIYGLAKRNDPRALPMLEQTLANIRKANGIPDPVAPVQAPAFDAAALLAKIEAAESAYDFEQLAEVKAQLRSLGAPPAPKTADKAPEPQPPARLPQPVASPAPGGDAESFEFQAIHDALMGLGVESPGARVADLLKAHPELEKLPVGARLKAVIATHRGMEPAPQPPRRPAVGQPLSGRGGPVRAGGNPNTDPLSHALKR